MWFDIMKALFFLQISWFRTINDKPPRPKSLDTTRLLQAAGAQVFHPECLKVWRSEKRYPVSRYPLSKLAPLRQGPRAAALPPEVKKANGWKKISARSLDRDPFTVSSSNIFKKNTDHLETGWKLVPKKDAKGHLCHQPGFPAVSNVVSLELGSRTTSPYPSLLVKAASLVNLYIREKTPSAIVGEVLNTDIWISPPTIEKLGCLMTCPWTACLGFGHERCRNTICCFKMHQFDPKLAQNHGVLGLSILSNLQIPPERWPRWVQEVRNASCFGNRKFMVRWGLDSKSRKNHPQTRFATQFSLPQTTESPRPTFGRTPHPATHIEAKSFRNISVPPKQRCPRNKGGTKKNTVPWNKYRNQNKDVKRFLKKVSTCWWSCMSFIFIILHDVLSNNPKSH